MKQRYQKLCSATLKTICLKVVSKNFEHCLLMYTCTFFWSKWRILFLKGSHKFFHPLICLRSQEQASLTLIQEAKIELKTYIVSLINWRLNSKLPKGNTYLWLTKQIRKKTIVTSEQYIPVSFCKSSRYNVIAGRRWCRCLSRSFSLILSIFVGHICILRYTSKLCYSRVKIHTTIEKERSKFPKRFLIFLNQL